MTEIMRFKNHNYLLNFLLFVSSLKHVPYRKSMFLSFCCPLDPAVWGGHNTRIVLSQAGQAINTGKNDIAAVMFLCYCPPVPLMLRKG
jgi:hypothetical protein